VIVSRVEEKVDAATQEVAAIQLRIGPLEDTAKELEEVRKKLGELEVVVGGVQGEVKAGGKRIEGLEAKTEEARLRNMLALHEHAQTRQALLTGLAQRLTKVEQYAFSLDYCLVTAESQLVWSDQKLQGVWLVISSANTEEVHVQTTALQKTWISAREANQQRIENTPPNGYGTRLTYVGSIRPTANVFIPAHRNTVPPQNNPPNSY